MSQNVVAGFLIDGVFKPVTSTFRLPVDLGASVALSGDLEIGGVYLQDFSGNRVAVNGDSLKIDGSSVTQPVSLVSVPLATGAATSSKQDDQTTALAAISSSNSSSDTHLAAIDTRLAGTLPVSLASLPALAAGSNNIGHVTVDNASLAVTGAFYQVTQPVSGTFWQTTQPISVASLPLPALAATSTLQSTINTTLGSPFQAGGSIGNTSFGISGTLPAFAATPTFTVGNSSLAVTGTFWQSTQPISVASLPLPSLAATSTLQTSIGATDHADAAAINATLGSPFQAGGSIGNSSFGISGTLPAFTSTPTFNLGTLNGAATTSGQSAIIAAIGTPMQTTGGTVGLVAGSAVIGHVIFDNATLAVTGSFYQATQPVSATALPLPSNAAQETGGNLATIVQSVAALDKPVGADEDSVRRCLNSIEALLQSVDLRLRELPLNIAIALNQTLNVSGGPIRFSNTDSFDSFAFDSTKVLTN